MNIIIRPEESMDLLSQLEVDLLNTAPDERYNLYRNCLLAVLNAGSETDNAKLILEAHHAFDINILRSVHGVELELINPPMQGFVDGKLVRSIHKNLFAVLRDMVFINNAGHALDVPHERIGNTMYLTHLVFSLLRNAEALRIGELPNLIVCWGGTLC